MKSFQVDEIGKLAVELRSSLRATPLEKVLSQVVKSLLAQKRCTPWVRHHIVGYLCGTSSSDMPADMLAALDKALGAPPEVRNAVAHSQSDRADQPGRILEGYNTANFSIQRHAGEASVSLNVYARAHMP